MKHITRIRTLLAGAAMLGLAAGASAPAEAAFVYTFVPYEGNVVGVGTGTINTRGLAAFSGASGGGVVNPSTGAVFNRGTIDLYSGVFGTSGNFNIPPFGTSFATAASSSTGSPLALFPNTGSAGNLIGLPVGYVSGTPLSGGMVFNGATLASLGMTPGTYVTNWGSGLTADSFTVRILAAPLASAFTYTFIESGGNVVGTASGSFDLSTLVTSFGASGGGAVNPSTGAVFNRGTIDLFSGVFGTSGNFNIPAFGTSFATAASSSTGSPLALFPNTGTAGNLIGVPDGYVSGTPLSAGMVFNNATFASLGMTPGTYVTTYGTGPFTGTFTVRIQETPVAVPEPASLALFGAGLIGLATIRRRKPAPAAT